MTQLAAIWLTTCLCYPDEGPNVSRAQQETPEQVEQREFAHWAAEAAASYDLRCADEPDKPLALRREPILKWSNPERGRIYGHVFLWTSQGRPEAIASLYKWYHPFTHSSHEFQSLSSGGLSAMREGAAAWNCSEPGVAMQPLVDVPPPGDAAPERLRQMRAAARLLRAEATNREGEVFQLRLLTQPIYRYAETSGNLIDGALFAYVQATDPEVLLLVEARRDEQGGAVWRYGLARLNSIEMRVFRGAKQVWTAGELPWSEVRDRSRPYFTVRFEQ
ncbi:MAG TPA: hypothetical protein VGN42_01260 [Pirellulales bacterium]|nr:hypothetical protein [Pirellulales bacterium]